MAGPIEDAFADLGDNYPGSKYRRRAVAERPLPDPEDPDRWDSDPVMIKVDGVECEFFQIGALGAALRRAPVTLRKWIEMGIIPRERYRTPGNSVNGARRLWTRAQIEGMARIAREEGLFDGRAVGSTRFTERVKELFRELKASEP